MSILDDAEYDREKFYLGTLCKRGHDWNGLGHSLRHLKGYHCFDCGREYAEAYRARNKELIALQGHQWTKKNKERKAQASKAFYEKNKKRLLAEQKRHREKNWLQHNLKQKAYRLAHPVRIRDWRNKHRQAHPESRINEQSKRRARKLKCSYSKFSSADLRDRVSQFNGRCCYCGEDKPDMHLDHFLPLSAGGSHVLSNLVIACQTCNLRKHDRDPYHWFLEQDCFDLKRWKAILKLTGKAQENYNQIPLL